jgi:Asp-tRNA(Asn)/Glu-tRNA(Gln) amidotransferase A subunit family amidase
MAVDELTATELRDRIAAGQISSVEATQVALDRIGRIEPIVGAYLATFPNGVCEYGSIV